MTRIIVSLFTLLCSVMVHAAQPALTTANLTALDRVTLEAALKGNVAQLEPYLAPRFQASIQIPTEHGRHQTLIFTRGNFCCMPGRHARLRKTTGPEPSPEII